MKKRVTLLSPPSILTILTEDLLLKVFDCLIESSDKKSIRLVCKEFLRLESLHRKSLRVLRDESLLILLRRYGGIEHLDLSVCPPIDDRVVRLAIAVEAGDWARRLKTLVLCRATGLRCTGLRLLVRSCPCLEEIDLSYCCDLGDPEASALAEAKGLRDLKLVKCLGVTDVGLANIAIGCARLEKLNLKWCMEITDLGIRLLSMKCTELKFLDISYLKVTNKSLRFISSLQKLETLSMAQCPFVDNEGLLYLKNGNPSLQNIDVTRCDNVNSSGIINVIRGHEGLLQLTAGYCLPELATLLVHVQKDLKNLNLIRIDGARVSDLSLKTISLNCKKLVEIGLSKCIGVTDVGISDLVAGSSNLKTLDLTCCHSITDTALSAIADYCKKLVCLKLESCELITEKGLDRVGLCCSLLEEIDLTDCIGVNDAGLKGLSKCLELQYLRLGLCENISDKGLFYIGSNCTKLQELDLYRCIGIGNDGLAAISIGCKKLKKLNICYCTEISDNGLKHLGTLEELQELEMRRLLKVTNAGLISIAIGCKSLVELDLKRCYNIGDAGLWALAYYLCNLRQINIGYCPISDVGLFMVMEKLKCLQDAKLLHLTCMSLDGFEHALRASFNRLKKVKLLSTLKYLLSPELLRMLRARGCRVRWVDKPLVLT